MKLKELFTFLPKSDKPASYGKENGKYPFFTSSNVINKYVDEADYSGEFLIIGDGGTGNCKYYNGSFSVSDHNYVLKPINHKNTRLIRYFLMKDDYKVLNEGFKGVGIKNISKSYIGEIEYYKNSKYSDEFVVDSLDHINGEIDKLNNELFLFDELIKSRFIEMFGDISNQNETVKLESVAKVSSSHRVFTEEFVENGIPFYRGTEIAELASGKIPSNPYRISEEHYKRISSDDTKPKVGDILIPSICDKGQVWMVNTEAPFYYKDGRVLSISPNRELFNCRYFQYYLKEKLTYEYPLLGDGVTFAEFKIFIIKNFDIIVPKIELQNEFASFVELIDKLKFNVQKQIKYYQELLDLKMHEYFDVEEED